MFRAPRQLPPLDLMLQDLGAPAADTARYLDVSLRTLRGWKARQQAPRPAMLALFWESSWGASLVASTAHNGAIYARGLADSLARENAALRARIARLEALGDFGAANSPMMAPSMAIAATSVLVDVVAHGRQA